VRICNAAEVSARLMLRFGGKSCAGIGEPVDDEVVVETVQDNATQTFFVLPLNILLTHSAT